MGARKHSARARRTGTAGHARFRTCRTGENWGHGITIIGEPPWRGRAPTSAAFAYRLVGILAARVRQQAESQSQQRRARAPALHTISLMTHAAKNRRRLRRRRHAYRRHRGAPNVGKSTLFNRLVGSRRAIVGDEPGITRDRLYGEAEWRGRHLADSGYGRHSSGRQRVDPSGDLSPGQSGAHQADAIIMVVDGRTEMASPDIELARQLIRSGRPLFLAVNKVDTDKQQSLCRRVSSAGHPQTVPDFRRKCARRWTTCWSHPR